MLVDAGAEGVDTRTARRCAPLSALDTRSRVLGGALALYLVGIGFAAGLATERVRADLHRAEVLARYDEAVRQWQGYQMWLEKAGADVPAAGRRTDEMARAGGTIAPSARSTTQ